MNGQSCGCGMRPKSKEEKNLELRREAEQIVAGVERYSASDRTRREAEVSAAFPPMKKEAKAMKASTKTAAKATKTVAKAVKKTTKAAGKTTAAAMKSSTKMAGKGPTPAGMSTGRHDGDLC